MKKLLKNMKAVSLVMAVIMVFMTACTPATTLKSTITQTPSTAGIPPPVIVPGGAPVITPSTAAVAPPVITPGAPPVITPGRIVSITPGSITYPPPPPPPADTTAPRASLTIPANLATGVAVNSAISVTFGEALNPATINSTTFTLNQGATPIAGRVTYAGVTSTFTPNAALAPNTEYTATIATGCKDLAGNSLASPYTWKWTTGAATDIAAPLVTFASPVDGAAGVPINAKIGAFFSEAMDPLTVTAATFTVMQGTTPVSGVVTYVGMAATFTPNTALAPNTEYTATITTGVKDLAGNSLARSITWDWTTGAGPDITPPTLNSTINANGATGVSVNTKVGVLFSEALDPLTVTTDTFTLMQGTTPVSGIVTYIGLVATFTPNVALAPNTEYTATITTGVKDLAGNALANPYTWKFTTGAATDTTAPSVNTTIPANAATGVNINYPLISAAFTEAMDPLTLTTATFTLKQGTTPVPGMVTVTYGNTANFLLANTLAYNTVYTATITTGAKDLAGNALAADKVWTFTTGTASPPPPPPPPADTTAPTVLSTIPADAATGVAITTNVSAVFSEALDPATVNSTSFTLKQGAIPVAGAVTYSGVTATFDPSAGLAANTTYTANITTVVKDLAGNALAANKVWTFTTAAAADTTAPAVLSTNPADAATGVAITTNVSAVFSEALNPATVNSTTFTLKQGATPVAGAVTYSGVTATFDPSANLSYNTLYTANITTGVMDVAGNALVTSVVWTFRTGVAPIANPTAPVLGESARFVILASQKITTTGVTLISNGDIGILDQARSYYEGFTASTTPLGFVQVVNGVAYAHDDIGPVPSPYASIIAFINQVRTDLGIAYTFLAADPNPTAPTQACPANLGGLTLTRGVYKTSTGVTIPTALHLDAQGDPNSVFIITIDGDLTTGATGSIFLDNGALAKNVYWRVAGRTTIAAGTTFYGNVFSWAQINVLNGAQVTGRLFSVNEQVTLIGDTVTKAP